jgi:hypothetical protein
MPFDGNKLGSSVYKLSAGAPKTKYLVILETTTPEKVIQYQVIAKALNIPIQFRSLNELVASFHSVDENEGNREKNAKLKFNATKAKVSMFFKDRHYNQLLQEKCLEWGVPYDPNNIIFAADDSAFEVESQVWDGGKFNSSDNKIKGLKKRLSHFVDKALLKSASNKTGIMSGPGAETGPIIAAARVGYFFQLLREVKNEIFISEKNRLSPNSAVSYGAGPPLTPIKQAKSFVYDTLANMARKRSLRNQPVLINTGKMLLLCEPAKPENDSFDVTEQYLKFTPNSKEPISNNLLGYYTSENSPHSQVVSNLFITLESRSPEEIPPELARLVTGDMKVQAGHSAKCVAFNRVRPLEVVNEAPVAPTYYDVLNLWPSFDGADLLEYTAFDASDKVMLRKVAYNLYSAIVDEQVSPKKRRIVVVDDGSYASIIKMIYELTNNGMSKDFNMSTYEGGPLVRNGSSKHRATSFIDHVHGGTSEDRAKSIEQLVNIRRNGYSRFRYPSGIDPTKIMPPETNYSVPFLGKPEKKFCVAVFTSASSDNRKLNTTLQKYGKFLAKKSCGLVWGAGDRHSMGAVNQGYMDSKAVDKFVAGFTIPVIAESETSEGRMPGNCNFPQAYNKDIYERMAGMIETADAFVIAPGGIGTLQEFLALLRLRDELAEKFNKPIILYSPDLHNDNGNSKNFFWENTVRRFLGDDVWEKLEANPNRGVDGFYLAKSSVELQQITQALKSQFDHANDNSSPRMKRRAQRQELVA